MGVPFVKDQRVLKCTGLFVSQRLKAKNYQVQKIIQKSSTTSEIVLQLFVEMRKCLNIFFLENPGIHFLLCSLFAYYDYDANDEVLQPWQGL